MDKLLGRNSKRVIFELLLCSAAAWFFPLPVLATQSVVLVWTPSSGSYVAGYKICYGTASQNYGSQITVGKTNQATISGLADGKTYYFAAAAVDGEGNQGPFSNQAVYAVPTPAAKLTVLPRTGNNFSFSVSGVSGYQYIVQCSTNLVNWLSVQTNTAPFTFTNSSAAKFNRCIYRAFYLPP